MPPPVECQGGRSLSEIAQSRSATHGINPELTVRSNRRAYALPRQIAMYIARQLTGASLQEIGREFGGRHHTTVLHAINRIEAMRRSDGGLDRTITRLVDAFAVRT